MFLIKPFRVTVTVTELNVLFVKESVKLFISSETADDMRKLKGVRPPEMKQRSTLSF